MLLINYEYTVHESLEASQSLNDSIYCGWVSIKRHLMLFDHGEECEKKPGWAGSGVIKWPTFIGFYLTVGPYVTKSL